MDCRLHFKDVFFVSAPWYLQDKNTWPLSEEMGAIGRGQRHGRRSAGGGFVSIRSNGLSFFNVFTERLENQRTSASKGGREKKSPTKAVKTFGLSFGSVNAKQIGGIFFFSHYAPQMLGRFICTPCCVWLKHQLKGNMGRLPRSLCVVQQTLSSVCSFARSQTFT